jgi:hypothetical protein
MEKKELREEVEVLFNDQIEVLQESLHTLIVVDNIDDKKSVLEIVKSLVQDMIDECDMIKNNLN